MVSRIAAQGSPATSSRISCLPNPIRCVSDKVHLLAQKVIGALLRVCVFQLGEYKYPLSYFLMRFYQFATWAPHHESVDRDRLERSKTLLLRFGGVESVAIPEDRNAEIRFMTFKASDFFKQIDKFGGEKVRVLIQDAQGQQQPRFAILPKPGVAPAAFAALCNDLKKFFLPTCQIPNGNTMQTGILLPESPHIPEDRGPPMVIHFHSPGRSMAMDRKFIGLHLGAGYDISVSDPRGTIDSTGYPSEGGYYLDADAVLHRVLDQGYDFDQIWVSGYCEGAAVAAHLKQKYHDRGINFVAENAFDTLSNTIRQKNFGSLCGHVAMQYIQSSDPAITSRVAQNGFDNLEKLKNLPLSSGRFVIIYTSPDSLVPPGSVENIREAIGDAGPCALIERVESDPKVDGHMKPPTEHPEIWRQYVEAVR